ncbi:MAG: hypothetical protein WA418_37435, partial [Bradyrhizobium sp.]
RDAPGRTFERHPAAEAAIVELEQITDGERPDSISLLKRRLPEGSASPEQCTLKIDVTSKDCAIEGGLLIENRILKPRVITERSSGKCGGCSEYDPIEVSVIIEHRAAEVGATFKDRSIEERRLAERHADEVRLFDE